MPSEKLKKDPIMALVTKTVATYMFIKHNNGGKRNPWNRGFLLVGRTILQKEGVRMTTKAKVKMQKVKVKVKAKIQKEKVRTRI
jgi:hypothetical protein